MHGNAKQACRRIFDEIWNEDDHGHLRELVGRECGFDDLPTGSRRSPPLLLLDLVNAYKAFVPDLRFQVVAQIQERRTVVTYWSAEGTHGGVALGVYPTRRRVRLHGALVARLTPRGNVASVHGSWDVRGFSQQVGVDCADLERMLAPGENSVPLRAIHECPGRPLLFFPTMSLPGWITWKRFIDALRGQRPVITYECLATRRALERQYPQSYALQDENRALRAALDASGCHGPYDIVGHSAGGTLALDFALEHPAEVRSLTLIEPGLAWLLSATDSIDPELRRFIAHRLTCYAGRLTRARYAAFLRETYGDANYDPTRSPRWPLLCAYMHNMRFRRALFTHVDDPERLRSLRCPVLLIKGQASDPYHRAAMHVLLRWIRDAELVEMPGGHVPHFGAGAAPFLALLERFHGTCRQRQAS